MSQFPTSTSAAPRSTRTMIRASALELYISTLRALETARVPFVVGGAFALRHYAGICRDTKDLDVFLMRQDLETALGALREIGHTTELTFPHWLAKASSGEHFVDIIFDSANGLCPVDEKWFEHAPVGTVFGVPVLLCPIEEVIWTKSFVMERERFDGADICHLLEAQGASGIDWQRLLDRYGEHWRVLLGHLSFFSFVYPNARENVPPWVMADLTRRLRDEGSIEEQLCRGTLISREQYLIDVHERSYADARRPPHGRVTEEDLAIWTAAIGTKK
jgi:hypothetical protein